jgi:WD40 repeat protein
MYIYSSLICCLFDNRLVEIQPNALCKVLGEHQEPVEQLRLSHDHRTVASCSHDKTVKLWDVVGIDLPTEGKAKSAKRIRNTGKLMKGKRDKQSVNQEFFADL